MIHAVGPTSEDPGALANCYYNSLECAKENGLSSIALCCISTGIFGYPNESAARVAAKVTREWLEADPENPKALDTIVFCVYEDVDLILYKSFLPFAFPTVDPPADALPGIEDGVRCGFCSTIASSVPRPIID